MTTFDDDHELFTNDNPALGIAKAGYYVAIIIATKALFEGQGTGDWFEVRDFAIYAALNLVLLNVATYSTDHLILKRFTLYDEICGKRNYSIAWVLAGCYVGSAFILNGAMAGDDGELFQSLLEVISYFALGQLMLAGGAWVFFMIHAKQNHAISENNEASGISMAGYLIGLGIIIGGMSKTSHGLNVYDLSQMVIVSSISVAFLIILRLTAFRYLFANGHHLQKEIYEDKNNAAGWILGFCTIAIAQLALTALYSY
jgi:uncharacterized membrane protein YjfL (UPF0719 family)